MVLLPVRRSRCLKEQLKFTFKKCLHRILAFELRRSGKAVNLTLSFLVCRLWHYQTRLSTNNSWCAECIWHYRRCISCSLLCKFSGLVIYFIPTAISVAQQNLNFLSPVTIININILWLSDCLYTYHKNTWQLNCILSTPWTVYKALCHVFICLAYSKCRRIWTECLIKMKCNS